MARIVGVEIPDNKKIEVSLTYIFGIGPTAAKNILAATGIAPEVRTKDLSQSDLAKLYEVIEKNYVVEGTLKQRVFQNIKRLKDIKAYRGARHKAGLPARGQRTRKNARTRKGKGIAVGGLNKKLEKK